jgi:hypothetical protein
MFVLVTLTLAYVLTNLGMLFRLRVIAFLPLWMATLAISRAPVSSVMTPHPSRAPDARIVRVGVASLSPQAGRGSPPVSPALTGGPALQSA